MKPFSRAALRARQISPVTTRSYSSTARMFQPTAIHRAEAEADRKAHPESQATQEKLPDRKGSHHWDESNATPSEADVRADREAEKRREEEAKKQK
ncbi:hypothetical protein ABEF95_002787 [Exophiala dermatitidis]